jgi:hypothetical protein
MEKTEAKFYVAMDEQGNWVVGVEDNIPEMIAEMQSDNGTVMVRTVELVVLMTPPSLKATVDVPDEAGDVKVTSA